MSLFQATINQMNAALQNDIQLLEKESLALGSETLEEPKYKSLVSGYIYSNKSAAIEGSLTLLKDEIKLLDEAFTEDMIKDLDYFMEKNNKAYPNAHASRIIDARLDIVRFMKAKISKKDFNRDLKTIANNLKNIRRHITLAPPRIILQKPHDTLKSLIFDINQQDAYKFGNEDYVEQIRLSDDAVKVLMDILTEGKRKRMPRVEDDYIEQQHKYLYGDEFS